jgi:hypothetical protein
MITIGGINFLYRVIPVMPQIRFANRACWNAIPLSGLNKLSNKIKKALAFYHIYGA